MNNIVSRQSCSCMSLTNAGMLRHPFFAQQLSSKISMTNICGRTKATNTRCISKNNTDIMQRIVLDSIRLNADIVDRDECEKGIRRVLNLGHTIAQAIEKCSRKLNHGEAVAVGLSKISHISNSLDILSSEDMLRIDNLLERIGFSLDLPVSISDMLREIRYDKKKSDNILRLVLPESIGSCRIEEMSFGEVERTFNLLK